MILKESRDPSSAASVVDEETFDLPNAQARLTASQLEQP